MESIDAMKRIPARQRFWPKVDRPADSDACWEWLATKNPKGYGMFLGDDRFSTSAHRFAYELLVGPIPAGLVLDHLCRNRGCVNPAHLEPVTHAENMRRARLVECDRGHPMTGDNVWEYTVRGKCRRECIACIALRGRRPPLRV